MPKVAKKKLVVSHSEITVDLTQSYNGQPTLGEQLERVVRKHYEISPDKPGEYWRRDWVVSRALRVTLELIIQTGDSSMLSEPGRTEFLSRFPAKGGPQAQNVINVDFCGGYAASV